MPVSDFQNSDKNTTQPQSTIMELESHLADRRIGQILMAQGKLTVEGAEQILRHQHEKGIRFGEAALDLGLVREEDIWQVVAEQFEFRYLKQREDPQFDPSLLPYESFNPEMEVFRSIRNQLLYRWQFNKRKILAVISSRKGDGRSYVAHKLAIVFAQFAQRTLVIDGDLRNPCLHTLFDIKNEGSGLVGVLSGHSKEEAVLRLPGFESLHCLPAGKIPADPLKLLSRERLHDLLHSEVAKYDVVLIDTPAAESYPDYQALGGWAKAGIFVARRGGTSFAETESIKQSLRTVRCQLLGGLINDH